MGKIKVHRHPSTDEPDFGATVIQCRAVLQKTDLKANNNKFYSIELHRGGKGGYRIFTHYGRTGDLEKNPNAGIKECRYFSLNDAAKTEYDRIYKAKTSKRKGYIEIALASGKIGSEKARGESSGKLDKETLAKVKSKLKAIKSNIPKAVAPVISRLYGAATSALTNTVQAKITAKGIETPLGVLTLSQLDLGEGILTKLAQAAKDYDVLSGQFYSVIPHKLGRNKADVMAAIIDTPQKLIEKQNTIQLMRDMLQVNSSDALYTDDFGSKYDALNCNITPVVGGKLVELKDFLLNSFVHKRYPRFKLLNIYAVTRKGKKFKDIGNKKLLVHGSRIGNWVGLLTRGILMPKVVVQMGGKRTDGGWLGAGIYFGNATDTGVFYTTPSKDGVRYLTIAEVSLGNVKKYTSRVFNLTKPPRGYNSCHGVRRQRGFTSSFDDDEFVVYDDEQQRIQFLVEFKI